MQFPWQFLAIPLLLFGFWLLSNLFKAAEDTKDIPRPNRGEPRRGQPRRPMTDLDRFLAQTRQRREAQEQPRPAPRPEPRPARPVEQRPQRPVERPQRPVEQRPQRLREPYSASTPPSGRRPSTSPPPPPAVTALRPVLLELVPEPVPVPQAKTGEARTTQEVPIPAPPPPPTPAVVVGRDRPISPVLAQVITLLRSPQSAAVGLVLREVLDRPRSQRALGSNT